MIFRRYFAAVREQTKSCLAHKDYPYTSLDEKMLEDDKLCVIYQGKIYESRKKKLYVKKNLLTCRYVCQDNSLPFKRNERRHL